MLFQDEIHQLMHDKDLKSLVASMKSEAKVRFAAVTDIVQSKELWRKAKAFG